MFDSTKTFKSTYIIASQDGAKYLLNNLSLYILLQVVGCSVVLGENVLYSPNKYYFQMKIKLNQIVKLSMLLSLITGASNIHSTSLSTKLETDKAKIISAIEKLVKEEKYKYDTEVQNLVANYYCSIKNPYCSDDKLKGLIYNYKAYISSNLKAKKGCCKKMNALMVGASLVTSLGASLGAWFQEEQSILDSQHIYYLKIGTLVSFTCLGISSACHGISSYFSNKELNKFKLAIKLAIKRENSTIVDELENDTQVDTSDNKTVDKGSDNKNTQNTEDSLTLSDKIKKISASTKQIQIDKYKMTSVIGNLISEGTYQDKPELIEAINKYKSDINSCTDTDKLKYLIDNYDVHILSNLNTKKGCCKKIITLIDRASLVAFIGSLIGAFTGVYQVRYSTGETQDVDFFDAHFKDFVVGTMVSFSCLCISFACHGISSCISFCNSNKDKELNKFKKALERENSTIVDELENDTQVDTSDNKTVDKESDNKNTQNTEDSLTLSNKTKKISASTAKQIQIDKDKMTSVIGNLISEGTYKDKPEFVEAIKKYLKDIEDNYQLNEFGDLKDLLDNYDVQILSNINAKKGYCKKIITLIHRTSLVASIGSLIGASIGLEISSTDATILYGQDVDFLEDPFVLGTLVSLASFGISSACLGISSWISSYISNKELNKFKIALKRENSTIVDELENDTQVDTSVDQENNNTNLTNIKLSIFQKNQLAAVTWVGKLFISELEVVRKKNIDLSQSLSDAKKQLAAVNSALTSKLAVVNGSLTSNNLELVSGVLTHKLEKEKKALSQSLTATKNQLAVAQQEKNTLSQSLTATKNQLAVAQQEKSTLSQSLTATKKQLAVAQQENIDLSQSLTATKNQLAVAQKAKTALSQSLTATKNQLAVAQKAKSTLTSQQAKEENNNLVAQLEEAKSHITLYTKIGKCASCFLVLLSLAIACYVYHTDIQSYFLILKKLLENNSQRREIT